MVEPKAQDDLETENQDQKQEVKEGTLTNKKNSVTTLKDSILQIVILIGSVHYREHCKIEMVTSFVDSEPHKWHKSKKFYPIDAAQDLSCLEEATRPHNFRSKIEIPGFQDRCLHVLWFK